MFIKNEKQKKRKGKKKLNSSFETNFQWNWFTSQIEEDDIMHYWNLLGKS